MFVVFDMRNKLNILIVLFVLISLLLTCYIFSNSLQKPVDSNNKSNTISDKLQSIIDPEFKIEKKDFRKYTRKAAHFIEFAALGISLAIVFLCVYIKNSKLFVSLPLFLVLSVAVIDEFIQNFNGRTSCLKDVLIDFSGSISGILIVFTIAIICRRMKIKQSKIK